MYDLSRRTLILSAPAFALSARTALAGHAEMTVDQARAAALAGDLVLIDIRTPQEWAVSGVPDVATPIDMRAPDFLARIAELKRERPERMIGFICATGGRSAYVASYLHDAGLDRIVDVTGGVHRRPDGWLAHSLPVKRPE